MSEVARRFQFFRIKSWKRKEVLHRCLTCFLLTDDPENHARWHFVNEDVSPYAGWPQNPGRGRGYEVTYLLRESMRAEGRSDRHIVVERIAA